MTIFQRTLNRLERPTFIGTSVICQFFKSPNTIKQQFTLHHHQLDLQIDSQNIKHVDLAKLSKASNPSSNKFQRQISDAFEQKCAFLLFLSPLILYAFWDVDKGKFSAAGFWTQKGPVVTHKFMSRRIPKSSSIQNYIYKGCSQKAQFQISHISRIWNNDAILVFQNNKDRR